MGKRCIYLGVPGYGSMSANTCRGIYCAVRDREELSWRYQNGSLLASNFNQLWCDAMNITAAGKKIDYFAMLHDDIGPQDWWLDMLIEELEAKELDVLGVAVPIKDTRGLTSLALHKEGDNWLPHCRLTMRDVFQLPETFTGDDLGYQLLLNTGCWVCKFDMQWATQVHFTINDRIVYNRTAGKYQAQTEPEDWYFSRLCHEQGLKIGATRKIKVRHSGRMDFQNEQPWGSHAFDGESAEISPVPGAFPYDVPGWLQEAEGRKLAELATGRRVLEIGSYCGKSTICLARTAHSVIAVDYFDGRGTPEPKDTREDFEANCKRYGVRESIVVSEPDGENIELYGEYGYDLIFIDGAHDYGSVRRDIEKYLPLLAEGGLVAFHDYNEPCHPGVTDAVDELLAAGGELLSVTEFLAVVKPPSQVPLEV